MVQTPTGVSEVRFKSGRKDWAEFEVQLYSDEGDTIPLRTYSRVNFMAVTDNIQKRQLNELEESYVNPRGNIDVSIEEMGPKKRVSLAPSNN